MSILKEVNTVSTQDRISIYKKIAMFNGDNNESNCDDYFEIRTGHKSALFTLWHYNHITHQYEFTHILTKTLDSAVDKAIDIINKINTDTYLVLIEDQTVTYSRDSTIFTFGKYKGQKIEEVAKTDINYLMFFRKSIEVKNAVIRGQMKLVKKCIDNYFNEIIEHNKATEISEYIGNISDKIKKLEVEITKAKTVMSYYGEGDQLYYEGYVFGTGNKVSFYMSPRPDHLFKVYDVVEISSCSIKYNYQKLGIKYTGLNKVRVKKLNGNLIKK